MWAVGCIFAELLTLKPLFQGVEVKATPNPFQVLGSSAASALHTPALLFVTVFFGFSDMTAGPVEGNAFYIFFSDIP